MEILIDDNYCIITPFSPKLLREDVERLKYEINNNTNKKIGIDLSYVNESVIDFFELLKQMTNICLFNVQSDIFVLLTAMNYDKLTKIYISENDFKSSTRQLIKRNFQLVQ